MTRGILLLAFALLATGELIPECQLDSSGAVAHGIDSAMYIWASTERCHGASLEEAPVKCEVDITSSIRAVTAMANAIAKMTSSCGIVQTAAPKCGLAVNSLISASAGLAAASGKIADKCFDINGEYDGGILGRTTALGHCTVNAGKSVNGLFEAANTIQRAKANCPDGKKECAVSSLDVISVLSNLGAHLAASVEHCDKYHESSSSDAERRLTAPVGSPCDIPAKGPTVVEPKASNVKPADCADGILSAIAHLSNVAKVGMSIEHACQADSSRLYLEKEKESEATSGSPLMLALAAVLPITAVLSFVGGLRVARSRQQVSARSRHLEADEAQLLEE